MVRFPQIYSRIEKRCDNPGERLVLAQLRRCLTDDYIVWHDLPVGPLQRQPDFVVFNPRRGVLVLEVKHWRLASVGKANKAQVTLLQADGPKSCKHPEVQARECALQINNVLERDPQLKQTAGRYAGRCAVPYGWGVALSNIRRAEVAGSDFEQVFPASRTLLRDELLEDTSPEAFQERLWGLFTAFVPAALTLPQQDRVRWHLFPEIRVSNLSAAQKEAADKAGKFAIPDLMQVMDLNQEQAARTLGEGHRVIHGPAGSGKTMLLVFRAQHLAQQAQPGSQPVLVLCYNRPLADRVESMLRDRQVPADRVIVRSLHAWCKSMVARHQLPDPTHLTGPIYWDTLAQTTAKAVQDNTALQGQYEAVLIDEAHDFEADWLRMAAQLVNPATRSLLVLYDDAQSIYRPARKRFSFASVGIEAKGRRTNILRLNYRNTVEILALAMRCAEQLLTDAPESDTQMPRVCPTTAGRRGPLPQLLRFAAEADEAAALAERIAALLAQGTPANDVAVLCREHHWAALQAALKRQGIASQARGQAGNANIDWRARSVKLLTMHAAKGLEFPHVFIMRLDLMPGRFAPDDELRLLYVAMTRATQQLTLSGVGDSALMQRVANALAAVADLPASAA